MSKYSIVSLIFKTSEFESEESFEISREKSSNFPLKTLTDFGITLNENLAVKLSREYGYMMFFSIGLSFDFRVLQIVQVGIRL